VLDYGEVLETLDKYFMARETIKGVLRKYSLICSFIPKSGPITQNGAHVHMSLWKDGKNVTVDQGMKHYVSDVTNGFMAGILKGLPALISLIAPTYNSMKRLMPDASVGAIISWGVENKEAPLRYMAI
jgi:glutamine synthetase